MGRFRRRWMIGRIQATLNSLRLLLPLLEHGVGSLDGSLPLTHLLLCLGESLRALLIQRGLRRVSQDADGEVLGVAVPITLTCAPLVACGIHVAVVQPLRMSQLVGYHQRQRRDIK